MLELNLPAHAVSSDAEFVLVSVKCLRASSQVGLIIFHTQVYTELTSRRAGYR